MRCELVRARAASGGLGRRLREAPARPRICHGASKRRSVTRVAMAELDWQASDSRDLVRRDRTRALLYGLPCLVVSGLFAVWLKRHEPFLAAVFLGMFIAWLLTVALQI